eukprot:TRINITY_DN28382_c0_g1_i1.p1 TRINITY_DN28382_c0_g1~~TRINITY_DN28382_c0_g1_i1.p1  ORF type:complete len:305 (-),score=65.47 TRINITY_DN28382_c0_g1_i1:65-925(-)
MARPMQLLAASDAPSTAKILVAARLADIEVQLAAGGTETPCGHPVPELCLGNGNKVRYTDPILRRLGQVHGDAGRLGSSFIQEAQVDGWLEWVTLEVDHAELNGGELDVAKVCGSLEARLNASESPFLVGDRLSLADVSAVCSLRRPLAKVGAAKLAKDFPKTARWFADCDAACGGSSSGGAAGGGADNAAGAQAPAFQYTEGQGSPAAVYWGWFRKALCMRLLQAARAAGVEDAKKAVLSKPSVDGLCRTCAETFGRPLSATEVAHLQAAPVSAQWLQSVLAETA